VVEEGIFAYIFTSPMASLRALIFSRSRPDGDFLVVVLLHSYPFPKAYEIFFMIIGLNGLTSCSFSVSAMFADGDVTLFTILALMF